MNRSLAFSWRLFLAFAAVALAFTVSAAYVNAESLAIDAETEALIDNAFPSMEHLGVAAHRIHGIQTTAADYAAMPGDRAESRRVMEEAWRKVDRDLAGYLATPFYAGERERYENEVPGALRAVDGAIARLFVTVEGGAAAPAREAALQEVRHTSIHAGDILTDLVAFNRAHAHEHVQQIAAVRHRASRIALGLNAAAVAVGVAVLIWVLRVFRTGARLEQGQRALVERRAADLELFGTRVAHDLLSPLSALSFCLGAFKRPAEHDATLGEALSRARSCVTRAQRMVESIFEFSRAGGEPPRGARADLREVAFQVAAEIRATELRDRPEVVIEDFDHYEIGCTPGVLSSLLANLMGNAAKYLADSSVRRVTVRATEASGTVRIEVEDTGPGVPTGLEEAIFEPYVRAAGATQAGLGLGLATVRRLCAAHGGQTGVTSSPGRGSVFWVTLPSAPRADAAPESARRVRRAG